MLRSTLLAGLLTAGVALPAVAEADTSALWSAVNGGAAPQACHDGAWLPGTLQVDQGLRPAQGKETGQVLQRSPARADCAYV